MLDYRLSPLGDELPGKLIQLLLFLEFTKLIESISLLHHNIEDEHLVHMIEDKTFFSIVQFHELCPVDETVLLKLELDK